MSNRLNNEKSPYLLQHRDNPVDWYPWCEEAFCRAREEDKPVFLSIGYSTCHWCHVMAHESFEDAEIAELLNRYFISVKVDREERPDIDSVYMSVCQAFTGSGGWPMSIFMTADGKPFFAGTYFPKTSRGGFIGMKELLLIVHEKWESEREMLLDRADKVIGHIAAEAAVNHADAESLPREAVRIYGRMFDEENGGFGTAPKFPAAHNLMFLLEYYDRYRDEDCLAMAERTLMQMYRGGLFDHIGYGFCRYSTDERFLVPHFEKMLYDNALLISAYCRAYSITGKSIYLTIAEKTASFILREMTSPDGGFYSALDADSDGEEGRYYVFTPEDIIELLGSKDGEAFNRRYGITHEGNFEGKSIPNLLSSDLENRAFDGLMPHIERFRKERCELHLDDKVLTAWNALMISAMCRLYRVSGNGIYLAAAKNADEFVREHLREGDEFYVSYRDGRRGVSGFLDDYAAYIEAQLELYGATFERRYLDDAERMCGAVLDRFSDGEGGFWLYAADSERLIVRPKETYDGAMPSGNSIMAYDLVRLSSLVGGERYPRAADKQLRFMAGHTKEYPAGYAVYLRAVLHSEEPPQKIIIVPGNDTDRAKTALTVPSDADALMLDGPTDDYPLKNGETTYYVCRGRTCLPPVNDLSEITVTA